MNAGDVVLVRFPFANIATTKKRPALVLSRAARTARYRLATLAMITSQVEALKLDGEVLLKDWKSAGLLHPSLLRLAKVATVDVDLVDEGLGRLSAADRASARDSFRRLFPPWVS